MDNSKAEVQEVTAAAGQQVKKGQKVHPHCCHPCICFTSAVYVTGPNSTKDCSVAAGGRGSACTHLKAA